MRCQVPNNLDPYILDKQCHSLRSPKRQIPLEEECIKALEGTNIYYELIPCLIGSGSLLQEDTNPFEEGSD